MVVVALHAGIHFINSNLTNLIKSVISTYFYLNVLKIYLNFLKIDLNSPTIYLNILKIYLNNLKSYLNVLKITQITSKSTSISLTSTSYICATMCHHFYSWIFVPLCAIMCHKTWCTFTDVYLCQNVAQNMAHSYQCIYFWRIYVSALS